MTIFEAFKDLYIWGIISFGVGFLLWCFRK